MKGPFLRSLYCGEDFAVQVSHSHERIRWIEDVKKYIALR